MEIFLDDIVTNILSKVDRTLRVTNYVDDFTIEVCSIKWAGLFNAINVDGVSVRIDKIDVENSLVKFKTSIAGATKFEMPNVEFFIGSERDANKEWTNFSNDMLKKIPFVWCNLTSQMRVDVADSMLPYDETYNNVELLFIADMNKSQWLVKQTLNQRTKLLKAWAKSFIDVLQSNSIGITLETQPQLAFFPEFGREDSSGVRREIIAANLSAVALTFDMNVDWNQCKC